MKTCWKLLALAAAVATPACSKNQAEPAQAGLPAEPHRFVYSMASPGEVTLLDLNSVEREGDVAQAWSLSFMAEPVKLNEAPRAAKVYWLRTRIDCAAGTGVFIRAIGLESGQTVFDVPVQSDPTPLAEAWPLDEEFICKQVEAVNVAGATFAEGEAAALKIMQPPTASPAAAAPAAP